MDDQIPTGIIYQEIHISNAILATLLDIPLKIVVSILGVIIVVTKAIHSTSIASSS